MKSDAHPLVEITVMQAARSRMLVHLVTLSGHSDTAYFAPIEMRNVTVQTAREIRRARAVGLDQALSITHDGGYWRFTPPTLKAYDVVVLE